MLKRLAVLLLLMCSSTTAWADAAKDCAEKSGDVAIAACDEAIRINPRLASAFNSRGIAYRAKGDNDRAIADHNEAIRLNPQYAQAFNNRGGAYHVKGDYDRAIADYNEAIRFNPQYALAFSNRGIAYRAKGDNDRAIADYNEAIRLNPKQADAFNNRGNVYRAKGDLDRAIADYNEAIRLDPKLALAFNNRAAAYHAKGDYERAIADYNEAIRLNPNYADAVKNRDLAYQARTKVRDAVSSPCVRIVGVWQWFVNGEVTFRADGTLVQGPLSGRWTCNDGNGEVVILWSHGFTDRVALSADGNRLRGTNNLGDVISGERKMAAATPAPPPPSIPGPQTPARQTTSEWHKIELAVTLKASGPNNPRGSLGVNLLDDDTFSALLSPDLPRGYFVISDDEGSAAGGRIRRGDVITMIDGRAPRSGAHVRSLVTRHPAGTEVKIEYWRHNGGYPRLRQSISRRSQERDATATYLLGVLIGVAALDKPDHARAFELFMKAGELGSHHAMLAAADAIAAGRGTPRSLPDAARWYRHAINGGSISAAYILADLLASGQAGPANPPESFRLMVRAATAGHVRANYDLARYYDTGYGAQKNPDAAARHLIEAIRKGDTAMLVRFSSEINWTRSQEFYTHLQLRLQESGVYQGPIDGKLNPQVLVAFVRLQVGTTP